ncbi:GNAT family N-acetyltransferase [Candidatus Methylacidithermus pantelleriae]|uniref:GNAT family N-acetyltransferase n=2 Tax=Candidatus Methylacidithermus pantelleriae TaxID=2744239 RepID=A0A8J2BN16_9BACT|nr:GNAT family N-acetyltransferase [Candidatus Methylacidithermus pantelleriae]
MPLIRPTGTEDFPRIWEIFRRVVEEGESYPQDEPWLTRQRVWDMWFGEGVRSFVAVEKGDVLGAYGLRANQPGRGSHVANAFFIVDPAYRRQGIGRAMALHALGEARRMGYEAMQFNFVVSTNTPAVRLWKSLGFRVVGVIPNAFRHKEKGLVDVWIMYRSLQDLDLPPT